MTTHPLVSVIVPVFNRVGSLQRAIQSILDQECEPLEIVVVDDGSTDGSSDLARSYGERVRCLSQPHKGVSPARNLGLTNTRGDLIAFLDSDDLWTAGSLATRRAYLEQHHEVSLVYGRTRVRDVTDGKRRFSSHQDDPVLTPMLGSLLCRRTVFETVGMFDESFHHSEDVEWLTRVRAAGLELVPLEAIVYEYHIHGANMTFQAERNQAFLFKALRRSLSRGKS